jgi:hypothetical protein
MELQHVNVRLRIMDGKLDLAQLVPVFHSWIQEQVMGDLLLDVADYRHVPAGPGVVLIGHQGDYSVDNTDNRLGVRYNRKAPLAGTNEDRLRQAAQAALSACQRLENEPRLEGKLRFDGREIELFINDRLLAPNREETRRAIQPELDAFFQKLLPGDAYSSFYENEPRRLFAMSVTASRSFSAADLLANLHS